MLSFENLSDLLEELNNAASSHHLPRLLASIAREVKVSNKVKKINNVMSVNNHSSEALHRRKKFKGSSEAKLESQNYASNNSTDEEMGDASEEMHITVPTFNKYSVLMETSEDNENTTASGEPTATDKPKPATSQCKLPPIVVTSKITNYKVFQDEIKKQVEKEFSLQFYSSM